ncbi:NAD(P)-dependent oxidoreductase [Pseudogemmobacter humi]|uniref:2-(Hydroxymethyl)glutarate dehydrogenase n=1 Tax=Pseudogemmobacter humi TaxID=2483812 RepID=A0A3P5X7T7_9RHOB|nr:NAD(P)-dependent oxidoreductase [Pseudogemmobacter humi]VDC30490.1 2-(hydroxymethyl)glutarate dehydrogenase [Pseudogemmobacter humi]
MRIGFIGLGTMGLPMIENLANQPDFELLAFDPSDTPFSALAGHKAWATRLCRADALGDLSGCDLIITMLPNSRITNAVMRGEEGRPGLAQILRPGARILDMGSSDPGSTMKLAQELAAKGISLTDAPVSGAVTKARTGELSIMVGTDAEGLETLRPVLSAMGRVLIPTGAVGSAHAMKALNNYVYAAGLLAASEALGIAARMGLDLAVLSDVLNASSGRNVATETKLRQFILPGSYNGGFALRLQAKDLATADGLQALSGFDAPQLTLCAGLWAEAVQQLPADADNTEIHRFLTARPGKSD